MHDIRAIRENPDAFDTAMKRRGLSGVSGDVLALDQARRTSILAAETAMAERNAASKQVGAAKGRGDDAEFERLRALVSDKKAEIADLDEASKAQDAALRDLLMGLPNAMYDDVPDGKTEDDNVLIHTWGSPRDFAFDPVEHYELPAAVGLDFETAAKLSGSRFVMLRGAMSRLNRALAQFMLDFHTENHGLTEINCPVIVRSEAMTGTGQLPKFAEDSYQTTNGWWLIPTSEVPLTNTVADEIVAGNTLPIRMTAHTLNFRSEAGSAGKDTAGMLRQHQFEKVEMVSIAHPDASEAEHKRMTQCAQNILEALELPYRIVLLCSGDTGFGARRTHDLEVWMPGQNTYREISSVSTCGDFQARRMNARFRNDDGKPQYVHTLNGTGVAIGRCIIAVLENGQQADGSVDLPKALHPYLGGKTRIDATGTMV